LPTKPGGALEYIEHGKNGIFFQEQTVASLKSAILLFESQTQWDEKLIRQSAQNFSEAKFQQQFSHITQV
jgi:Glycosyl transferases group 1.